MLNFSSILKKNSELKSIKNSKPKQLDLFMEIFKINTI